MTPKTKINPKKSKFVFFKLIKYINEYPQPIPSGFDSGSKILATGLIGSGSGSDFNFKELIPTDSSSGS